jgi:uncharacterized protein (DUF849 family)
MECWLSYKQTRNQWRIKIMAKVIVTAAINGSVHTPTMSPYLPITPQQIADEAVRVYEAGGAIAHVHVRNPADGMPVSDTELFREVATEVKSRCNIIARPLAATKGDLEKSLSTWYNEG